MPLDTYIKQQVILNKQYDIKYLSHNSLTKYHWIEIIEQTKCNLMN